MEDDSEPPVEEPDPTLYGEDLPAESDSIIYVLDVSGSMNWGESSYTDLDGQPTVGTKLDRARTEVARSVQALTDDFEFNIFVYDCGTRYFRPDTVRADPAGKMAGMAWVQSITSGGATGTGPATALALNDKENMTVALLSDGSPNCGASGFGGHRSMISGANSQGATIHTFGIAASGQFAGFLQDVASDAGGRYIHIP
jgi:Mg-chelatase subunit ChlD